MLITWRAVGGRLAGFVGPAPLQNFVGDFCPIKSREIAGDFHGGCSGQSSQRRKIR